MQFAKVRLIVSLIIVVVIVTFVYFSTSRTTVHFAFYGGEAKVPLPAWIVIILSLGVGFVLGYFFRITRLFRKKAPKKLQK